MSAREHRAHALGRWGEDQATRYLERRGWAVLERNYRFGLREVDLVARLGDVVAFVEVKTRGGAAFGHPWEAITRLKRREVEAVAADFLRRHRLGRVVVRFDAIAVVGGPGVGDGSARIEHLEDAWRPEWA